MPPVSPAVSVPSVPPVRSFRRSTLLRIPNARNTPLTAASLKEHYQVLFMSNRTATRILASRVAVRLSLLVLLLLGILPGGFAA